MQKLLKIIFLSSVLISTSMAEIKVVDDSGKDVILNAPAKRIISLAPHTTELLFTAGAEKKLIGVVDYSNYPQAAKKLPSVGSGYLLDIEKILSLEPDLIVGWKSGNQSAQLMQLRNLGLNLYLSEPRSLEDVAENLRSLGLLIGNEKQANKLADDYLSKIEALKYKYKGAKPVRVFYQVWQQPLFTVNSEHIISHVIELCGGVNIFAELKVLSPQIDIESVISRNPEVIVAGAGETREDWLQNWQNWPSIKAVNDNQLYGIDADLIVRHTTRILQGANLMCEALQKAREH